MATIYALYHRRQLPALTFAIIGPLAYFSQSFGFVLSPAKLMGLVFLGFVLSVPKYLFVFKNKYLKSFLSYYVYTFFLTLFMSIFWPSNDAEFQSFLYSSTMRGMVQITQTFMGLAIIIMVISSMTSVNALYRMQVTLLVSMTLLCVYGIYVWLAQRMGLPFTPITRIGGELTTLNQLISTTIDGKMVIRAYSLSGEPKGLAVDACLGIILSYFTLAYRDTMFQRFGGQTSLIFLFLVTLYLTYSTAGYLILPIIFLSCLIVQWYVGIPSRKLFLHISILAAGTILASFLFEIDVGGKISAMLQERVEERIGDEGIFTYAEDAIIKFWSDRPELMLSGVGLGGSAFYIREYDIESYSGFIAAPRGIFGFIGDRGLIGLGLFYLALARCAQVMVTAVRLRSPNQYVYSGTLIICLVSGILLLTKSGWYLQWLAVGLACAGATLAEKEIRMAQAAKTVPAMAHGR